jgi:hypothetical protein
MPMKIITAAIARQLAANGKLAAQGRDTSDLRPVMKLFTPWGAATWLITESDPDDPDILFGLCDLGFGTPELGSVYLPELLAVRGPFGLKVERDLHFEAGKTLAEYADEARRLQRIAA